MTRILEGTYENIFALDIIYIKFSVFLDIVGAEFYDVS